MSDCEHDWTESAWNVYGICIEQVCRKCGKRRHLTPEDLRTVEPEWREGGLL